MRTLSTLALITLSAAACRDAVPTLWQVDTGASKPTTPLVSGSYIAVGNDAGVTLISPAGERLCTFAAQGPVRGAPRTDGKTLFFGSINHLFYAIDTHCTLLWKVPTGGAIAASPAVGEGVVYFASGDGHVFAADTATGELKWTYPAAEVIAAPEPIAAAAEPPPAVLKGRVRARAHARARIRTRHPEGRKAVAAAPPAPSAVHAATPVPPAAKPGAFGSAAPVLFDGVLYVGNSDHGLYALDAATGALKWRFATEGDIDGTAAVAGDRVYFGAGDGSVYAVDGSTQKAVWKIATQAPVRAKVALVEHMLYVAGQDKTLYAVDVVKGAVTWTYAASAALGAPPALYKGLVLLPGASTQTLWALRRVDASTFWKFEAPAPLENEPVASDDRAYVPCVDGTLYAFNLAGAPVE